ncbi:MAG TPA: hypothetical protein VII45_10600 [Solirubrobacterales bacterium]
MLKPVLTYAIDHDDRLVKVDEGYYRFGEEHGWDEVGASLGRSLWDFVAGDELKKLQRILLRRLRSEVRSVELPFRCDGPDVRREMNLRIVAHSSGRAVLFAAFMWAEEARDTLQPMLDPAAPRNDETLTMCGWCDRFRVDGEWVEIEVAAARLGLFQRVELPAISHDICADCSQMLLAA